MDWLEAIPPGLQGIATIVFVVAMAVLAAYFHRRGASEKDKVQEFAVSGQFSDMGPVRELVQQTGLLVQQQLRTNLALEAIINRADKLIGIYEGQIKDARNEREIEEEVARRLDQQLAERRRRQRRAAHPKP